MSEKCLKLKVFAKIDFIAFFGFLGIQFFPPLNLIL